MAFRSGKFDVEGETGTLQIEDRHIVAMGMIFSLSRFDRGHDVFSTLLIVLS